MEDKKFKVLLYLGGIWLFLFAVAMKVKSPRLEQFDILIAFICVGWFAYWTLSSLWQYYKKSKEILTSPMVDVPEKFKIKPIKGVKANAPKESNN
jgi:hypothetical protein